MKSEWRTGGAPSLEAGLGAASDAPAFRCHRSNTSSSNNENSNDNYYSDFNNVLDADAIQ